MAKCLDGRALSRAILAQLSDVLADHLAQGGQVPGLAAILVGDDAASQRYVKHKVAACECVGIRSQVHHLPSDTDLQTLQQSIQALNLDDDVHAILLQLPLPSPLRAADIIQSIAVHKDVDGFHPYHQGRLLCGQPDIWPCTPAGIIQLLRAASIDCRGQHAVICGASNIVGRPMAMSLLRQDATVSIAHKYTQDLAGLVQEADILITAIGQRDVIDAAWVKPGAVVIDVGMNRDAEGNICGDINVDACREAAAWITPTPGGVGPMTVAALMQNTLQCAGITWNRHAHNMSLLGAWPTA